MISVLVS